MDGAVATRCPAGALRKKPGMWNLPNIDCAAGSGGLSLRVTLQAKVLIWIGKHLRVRRTMRLVANRASLPQRLVLENERPGLFPVALATILVQSGQHQSAGRFQDIHSVRVMALNAVHAPFGNLMVVGQAEFETGLQMALEARARILSRIDDQLRSRPTRLRMQTAWAVA